MSFKKAVESIPRIKDCYRNGLQALEGQHRRKITPKDTRLCSGSVNLDDCLKRAEPREPRWDYIIGYNNRAYFAEVHPASGQVSEVIAKATWLRKWLKNEGSPVAAIHHNQKNFHWIPTNGVNMIGSDRRRLAENKILVIPQLALPQ